MKRFNLTATGIRLLMLLILCLVHPQNSFTQAKNFSGSDNYTYQPGDGIRVKVWQLVPQAAESGPASQLSDDYTIDGDGYALFPIIGRIKVKGMTTERLIETLKEKYSPFLREPVIYATPLIRIILNGAFQRPGAYRVKYNSSLWELVEQGGGPTIDCELNKLRVERGNRVVITNLLAQFEKGYAINEIGIQSGDQVIAPEKKSFNFEIVRDYLTFFMTAYLFYIRVK